MERIPICVYANDPVTHAGVVGQLRPRPEIEVVVDSADERVRVAVVAADEPDEDTLTLLRSLQRSGCPTVLVVTSMDDGGLAAAVEAGVAGLVRRCEATPERLVHAIGAVSRGEGTVPPDLLGRLLAQVSRVQQYLQPRGVSLTGLTSREADILRLIADGLDTNEIARSLSYSERTVKNVLHDVTSRLQLRNRSHAVAYALKQGLI